MPKYTKSKGEDRPYRRKYKSLSNYKHLTHVVAHIPNSIWSRMRKQAVVEKGKKHRKKVLPSSFQTLANTKYPAEFNRRLAEENERHEDHTQEFHKGGGLGTAFNAVTDQLWNEFAALPGGSIIHDLVSSPNHGEKLTQGDQENADVLTESYKQVEDRAVSIHGWIRVPRFDTDYVTVYWEPASNTVHVGVRGSRSFTDWTYHDVGILSAQHPGQEQTDEIRNELVAISKEYPDSEIYLNSHSLSGAFVTDSFNDASEEQTKALDNYDHLLYFNPGSSPIASDDSIEKRLQDDRVKLFLNKSDIINQGYVQAKHDDVYTVYGEPSINPMTAHGYKQWTSSDPEYSEMVNWGTDYFTDFGNNEWNVGESTGAAFETLGDTT